MINKVTILKEFHPFVEGESFDLKPITMLVGDQGAGKSTMLDLIIKYEKPKLAEVNIRYNRDGFIEGKKRGQYMNDPNIISAKNNFVDLSYVGDLKLCYVDTEKHNPRMTSGETTREYKDAIIETLRDEALHKLIQVMEGYKSNGYLINKTHASMRDLSIDDVTNNLLEKLGLYFDSKRGGSILGDEIKMDITTAQIATMQSHGQSIFPLIQKSTEGVTGGVIMLDEPETAMSLRSQYKLADIILNLSKNNQIIVATHSPIIMRIADTVLSLEHRKWMNTEEFINLHMNPNKQ